MHTIHTRPSSMRSSCTRATLFFAVPLASGIPARGLTAPRAIADTSTSTFVAEQAVESASQNVASASAAHPTLLGQAVNVVRSKLGSPEVPNLNLDLDLTSVNLDGLTSGFPQVDVEQQKAALSATASQVFERQQAATKNFVQHLGLPTEFPQLPQAPTLPDVSQMQLPTSDTLATDLQEIVEKMQMTSIVDVARDSVAPGTPLNTAGNFVGGVITSVASNFTVFGSDNWTLNILFFAALLGLTFSLITQPKY